MTVIGVTGGIGSGKSLVCRILEDKYKAYIINTDEIARKQMAKGGNSYINIVDYFGEDILLKNGEIDRIKLAIIVFNDNNELLKLNQITHPNVIERVKDIIANNKSDIIAIETALAVESGLDLLCNQVWFINSSEEIRKKRLMETRNLSEDKIKSIFKSQLKAKDFIDKGYVIIENNNGIKELEERIKKLLIYDII
ncbi:MAG TPA: dephospho-CoA kinase [Clostridiales bacterium]|nr:dephospho-CoA kinase [Clostridiales bacterium]